jgi:signal transduction histidine kinase
LVRGIVTDMKSQFDAHAHKLHLSLPKNPVQVKGDLGYLRMAIENIINNALAYTPDGGEIGVRLRVVDKVCKLLISDTGVGIRKADLSKLFIKFSRIHNPLSVQAGGSGIGLYLSAEIMRLHGGAVSADSKINQGTTFAISLPMAQNTT